MGRNDGYAMVSLREDKGRGTGDHKEPVSEVARQVIELVRSQRHKEETMHIY